ncbi:FAD-binding domain-containing protein [Wilcoxina mikolae CBS 423.85]|nr:FAD-binding domain-containing protein [Wilcoxina mikolae CBS 423.85]
MSHANDRILDDILNDDGIKQQFPGLNDVLAGDRDRRRLPDPGHGKTPGFVDEPPSGDGPPSDEPTPGPPSGKPTQSPEEFVRGILTAIQTHPEFKEARGQLSEAERGQLDGFLAGKSISDILQPHGRQIGAAQFEGPRFDLPASPASRRHFEALQDATLRTPQQALSHEGKSVDVQAADGAVFSNWGKTVLNTPRNTYVPTTVEDIQAIVRKAKNDRKRVRASGYRHTWTDMYSQNDHVLISMLDLGLVETLPNPESVQANQNYGNNEFKKIELAVQPDNPNRALVRLGAAVTNEDFRRWAVEHKEWTLPINVLMVEITIGGSNAPICHGAGITSQTLSDLVRQIEYVDANGEKQAVSDPKLLQAASGCFGLLGIVTHVTLELDKMTYAQLKPVRADLLLAIPPPAGYKFPNGSEELQQRLSKFSQAQLETARRQFIQSTESNYYSEWFWFPYQDQAFVNIWNNTSDSNGFVDYPNAVDTFLQWMAAWGGEVLNRSWLFRQLSADKQAYIMGTLAMTTMPSADVKTQLINGIHFRRGIQNMRVGDFEVEIPIPAETVGSNKRDWSLVQRAWWDGITAIYGDSTNVSARIALEMRITGGSSVVMAPQLGNNLGTASIEVITSMPAVQDPNGIWPAFKQHLADIWTSYTSPSGEKLNVRPHWAKEWEGINVDGKEWVTHIKENSHKDQIPEFKRLLGEIGSQQGWTLDDLQKTFSTPLLDRIIFE